MKGRGEFGRRGEDEACMYLVSQGHTILERNWRCGHLEIDVITLAGDGIHFVEVKSRMVPVQGRPEEAVNAAKQRKIVAAVTFGEGRMELEYFHSAFVPIYV